MMAWWLLIRTWLRPGSMVFKANSLAETRLSQPRIKSALPLDRRAAWISRCRAAIRTWEETAPPFCAMPN